MVVKMISEEQLEKWEGLLKTIPHSYPLGSALLNLIEEVREQRKGLENRWTHLEYAQNARVKLMEQVKQLEKEANWLASTLHLKGCVPEGIVIDWTKDGVRKAWREKARKEIQNENT